MSNPRFHSKAIAAAIAAVSAAACLMPMMAATLRGRVVDSAREPLPGTSVKVIAFPDTIQKGYMMANDDGKFSFSNLDKGNYVLLLEMVGMDDIGRNIEIPDSADIIDLGDIEMSENSVTLNEAVVTAVRAAVVAKQDTLEFNAGSFHTGPNAMVEDLLKKLPGVEVGSDGSITSGGKTVTKILVDGKEFFSDDPKMATKNLPSDIVEKVQVVDRKSDTARLTGVDDGEEETVINLTVKKGMNNGWFGSVGAGYGTDGRYQGSFNVSRFANGNQFTILGGANNINELGFTDSGRGRFRDFGGNNGINTSQNLGFNFNVGNDEKFRIGGNVMYTHSDRDSRRRNNTQYLYPDRINYEDGENSTRDKGHNVRGDFRMRWNIDDYNVIDFRPRFSFNSRNSSLSDRTTLRNDSESGQLVNSNTSSRYNQGTSWQANGDFIYNHKFASRPGRSFSVQMRYEFSNTLQNSTSWNDIVYYLLDDDNDDEGETLYRYINQRQWSNAIEGRLTWTEPLGDPSKGHFLNIAYRTKYSFNNSDKLTYNIPLPENTDNFFPPLFTEAPAGATEDFSLSNKFRNNFMTQELSIGYKRTTKKLNLDAGILFSPSSSKSEDLIDASRNIPTYWVWNVAPYARLRYKFSDTASIGANYRARTSAPSLTAMQPVADVSDPLNITIGNPDLKPTFTQSVSAHFHSYNPADQRSVMAVFNTSYSLNNVVSRTITDPETGGRTTTYANANGNWNVFAMSMVNQPLRNSHWRFNARMGVNYTSAAGYIDGDFNRSGNLRLNPTAGLTYSCDIFQMTVNPTYSFNMATNSLPRQRNQYVHSYGFDANVELDLPFGLGLSSDLSYSSSSGYASGFNTTQWLWGAQLTYSVLRDKSLTFSVKAYDLLGQKKNVSRNISANMISDMEYNDLTRYVMFGVTWQFNTLKKKTTSRQNGMGEDVPPPPGEGGHMGPPPTTRGGMPGPPPGGRGGFGGGNRF